MRPAKARALVTNAWALQGALLYIQLLLLLLFVIIYGSLDVLLHCLGAECSSGASVDVGALGEFFGF